MYGNSHPWYFRDYCKICIYCVYFWCVLIIDSTNVTSLFRSLNKCESMKHNVGLTMSV